MLKAIKDLSGKDAIRKIVILSREAGYRVAQGKVGNENEQLNIDNADDLLNLLKMTPYWYKGGERNSQLVHNAKLSSITL